MERKFLAVFTLPKPQPEHARIRTLIEEFSGGDCRQAFLNGTTIGFVFTTRLSVRQIDFAKAVLNGDSYLLVELGDAFSDQGMRMAADWLAKHRDER